VGKVKPPLAVVEVGDSVTFTCEEEEEVEWLFVSGTFGSHRIVRKEKFTELHLTNIQPRDAGKYWCRYEEMYYVEYDKARLVVKGKNF